MKKKANILSFKFSLALGGGERFSFLLSKGLIARGYNVRFFSNHSSLIKRLKSAGVKANKVYWGREVGAIRNLPVYFLLLPINLIVFFSIFILCKKRDRENIVVFQNLNEKIFATRLARTLGYRVFWVEHVSIDPWLTCGVFKQSYIRQSSRAEKIIVVSDSIKSELLTNLQVPSDKIETIYNGVDLAKFFVMDSKVIENEKKRHGFFKGSKIIGYAGRLHSEKGLDTLIHSFAELTKRFDHTYLILVGDGPMRKNLQSLIANLGLDKKVFLFGYQENVPLFLNMIDVFVLPSKVRESFGIVLIEAMAVKKAVVASNIGGIPEIVDDGIDGYLFPPGNEKELTDKLSILLANDELKKTMGQRAFGKVNKKFSVEIMLNKLENIFK